MHGLPPPPDATVRPTPLGDVVEGLCAGASRRGIAPGSVRLVLPSREVVIACVEGLFIDHGTGVVIGETSRIGNGVRLYQGVTLGAKSFPLDADGVPIKGIDRHPILEDDVVIYSGATVLGRITIGRGSSIGGNVWLTHSVPPGSRVTQAEARETRFEHGGGI